MPSAKFDLFPAFIIFIPRDDATPLTGIKSDPPTPVGSHRLDKARVVVSDDQILVAVDSEIGPKVVFKQLIVPGSFIQAASKEQDSYVTTVDGVRLAFRKNTACGCGSRLRSWSPYRTLHSTKNP